MLEKKMEYAADAAGAAGAKMELLRNVPILEGILTLTDTHPATSSRVARLLAMDKNVIAK